LSGFGGSEIVAVRGLGLLLGIEFAEPLLARRFVAETIARGAIVTWTLNADTVVRLAPPLTISASEIDFGIQTMRDALEAVRRGA
jgi:4-aminobutyrate aminotransferase-like enzyme